MDSTCQLVKLYAILYPYYEVIFGECFLFYLLLVKFLGWQGNMAKQNGGVTSAPNFQGGMNR
mgnify:CR=1 FL=1